LTLNGGPNLITGDVTVTQVDATTYRMGGLTPATAFDGDYVLTVSATGFTDQHGVAFWREFCSPASMRAAVLGSFMLNSPRSRTSRVGTAPVT
jgi:hypothetical protein